jgi:mitochondrial inner membrane protease subunit 1
MYPTLPKDPSWSIISRRHSHGRNIALGDIVVFANPNFPGSRACKRVVGMPGDYVIRDPPLHPTVGVYPTPIMSMNDGNEEEEVEALKGWRENEPQMIQVPEGHVWVAGDNLSHSRDSRFFGPLPMALIKGKTIYAGGFWRGWTSFRGIQMQPTIVDEGTVQHEDPA